MLNVFRLPFLLAYTDCGVVAGQILHNHVILERSSLRRPTFILRGRRILQWLGFADLMAAIGQ